MDLSKKQKHVVRLMKNGWCLYEDFDRAWLFKDGEPSQTEIVSRSTTKSLLNRNIIKVVSRGGASTTEYKLK